MKKAIANLSFSDLKVRYFTGRSILISDGARQKISVSKRLHDSAWRFGDFRMARDDNRAHRLPK